MGNPFSAKACKKQCIEAYAEEPAPLARLCRQIVQKQSCDTGHHEGGSPNDEEPSKIENRID